MTRRLLVVLTVAALGTIGLAACSSSSGGSGGSGPSGTSAPPGGSGAVPGGSGAGETTTTASPGTPFSATGFSTIIPDGWTDATTNSTAVSDVTPSGSGATGTTDLGLFQDPAGDAGHITIKSVAPQVADSDIPAYLASAGQNGATNLSQPQSFTLAGDTGQYITYDLPQSDGSTTHDQDMVVNHGSTTYDIILNVPTAEFASLVPALQEVLSSWQWS